MDPTQWGAPYPIIVVALFVIVMLRANGTYWLGRLGSAGAQHTRLAKLMASAGYQRAIERIDRFGPPIVAVSFLTIGFQTLANLAAGAVRMRQRHYLPAVTVGSIAWAFLYATLGVGGADVFARLYAQSPAAAMSVAVLVMGTILGYVIWQLRRRVDIE